jgi:hypothetical protein
MNIGEADVEGNEGATTIPRFPRRGRRRVLAKIAALEKSIQSEPQGLPSSPYSPLTAANLLHYQQQSREEIGRREHGSGGSHLGTGPKCTSDTSEEVDKSTPLDKHESYTSNPAYSLESDDQFEDGGESSAADEGETDASDSFYSRISDDQPEECSESTASDEHETDDYDPIYISESEDQEFEEAEKGTGGSRHQASGTDLVQTPKVSDHQGADADSTRSSGMELEERILEYLKTSTIGAAYGDFLSSSRSRRYQPKWPMHSMELEPSLPYPASQGEADVIFEELYKPLHGWNKLSENKTPVDAAVHQQAIFDILGAYDQKKMIRPPLEECSGNFLLYHNFPDAAKEVTVSSWINTVHVAIQQGQLELAAKRVDKAATLAGELDYRPLVSKCLYWKGRVMAGLGDRRSAAECFLDAFHCVGVYQEGELLSKEVAEYKLDMLELLDEQKARKGEDEWSLQARRALAGIDAWFRPLKDIPRQPSYVLSASSPEAFWPEDKIWGGIESNEVSPESQPSSEEDYEDYMSQLSRYAEPRWFSDRSLRPRKVDWALVGEIEEAVQNSVYVPRDTLYRVCEGFSSVFEDMIRGEKFTDGFDNYPDIGHSAAWKVLNYSRVKAKLKRPRVLPKEDEEELSPLAVGVSLWPGLIEANSQRLADSSTGTHVAAVDQLFNERPETISRGPPLTINTAHSSDRSNLSRSLPNVSRRILRVNITAEEKIAAFEHNLLHQDDYDEGKSKLRLELEKNHEWILDIQQQQSRFDQDVQGLMAKSNIDEIEAEDLVRSRNEEYLRDVWGPEGVRPPTPASTRTAREEERTRMIDESLNPFKLESISMTYRRKLGVYRRLPTEVKAEIEEPTKPAHIIAYLEEMDKLRVKTDDDSTSESPAIASKSNLADVGIGADGHNYGSPISPLRPHQGSSQTSATKSTDARCGEHGTPIDSAFSNSSTVTLQTYADIKRLLDAPRSRQLKAKLGIDAMSKAMRKARLKDEEISIEQLVQIGEIAIGGKLNLSRPKSTKS